MSEFKNLSFDDQKRIMRRLKKVLALAQSSNPGEAAAALHQAEAIMSKYGVTADDSAVADIVEADTTLSGAEISVWEKMLYSVVSKSLGVLAFTSSERKEKGYRRARARIVFVGESHRAQIAVYAFETLRRSLRKCMNESVNQILEQAGVDPVFKRSILKKADREAYARGWCQAVMGKVSALAPETPVAVSKYMEMRVGKHSSDHPSERSSKSKDPGKLAGYLARCGYEDGAQVQLHKGMGPRGQALLLTGA